MEREGGQGITVTSSINYLCSLMFAADVSAVSDTLLTTAKKDNCTGKLYFRK